MENGKYNLIHGREILTQPTSYRGKRNPATPCPHLTKTFFRGFFLNFPGEFFSLSARKTAILLGPVLLRRIEPVLKCEPCQQNHRLRLPAPLAGRRKTASANHIRERLFGGTNYHFLLLSLYSQESCSDQSVITLT